MPNVRAILDKHAPLLVTVTYQRVDDQFTGTWARPNVPLLIYDGSDPFFSSHSHSFLGGATAGAVTGHPVVLIFWGAWWDSNGAHRSAIIEQTQRMLASPYFDWLAQYGVSRAPRWGGALTCTKPVPPSSGDWLGITDEVLGMIGDLMDAGDIPDPDDGPRICFCVMLPQTFTLTTAGIAGAHSADYATGWPFYDDRYWGGWVVHNSDFNESCRVISHEVVETLVDPESDGWRWTPTPAGADALRTELCDGSEGQCAFVNGARVQAYFSSAHGAPIIPIDRDYKAQLKARARETRRREIDSGAFVPPDDLCHPSVPECCFGERTFQWHQFSIECTATVTLDWERYVDPACSNWSVNGVALAPGGSSVVIAVNTEEYSGLSSSIVNRNVAIAYTFSPDGRRLTLRPLSPTGNFDATVSCDVTDLTITGNPVVNVVANPRVTLGFKHAESLIDDAYGDQLGRCYNALLRRYLVEYKPVGRIEPEEGINWVQAVITRGIPAHVSYRDWARIRDFAKVFRATTDMYGESTAQRLDKAMFAAVPVLGALAKHRSREQELAPSAINVRWNVGSPFPNQEV